MGGLKYGYTPRRWRPRHQRNHTWWLAAVPAGAVILALVFGLWAGRGGGGEQATGTECPAGQECAGGGPAAAGAAGSPIPTPRPDTSIAANRSPATTPAPAITGLSAAVLEGPCGAPLYEFADHMQQPPASLTKIMTAIVAADNSDVSDMVNISIDGPGFSLSTDSTIMGIEPGMRLSMRDLLYGLLLPSGNDAALAIAEYVAGGTPEFVEMMNDKARELALANTHFSNPHGLDDPGLYTSAYDMAVMGNELLKYPELAEIVRTDIYQPDWDGPAVTNLNGLVGEGGYPGAVGIKTGYTDLAQQTMVAAAERDGRLIIVAVLGSSYIYQDVMSLLDWAFESTSPACTVG